MSINAATDGARTATDVMAVMFTPLVVLLTAITNFYLPK